MNFLNPAFRLFQSWLQPKTPAYLVYFVTYKCNARCQTCFFWEEMQAPQKKELSLEEVEKISSHLPPLIQLTLSGGEPFLRDDLYELVSIIARRTKPIFITIPTNGSLTQKITTITEKLCQAFPKVLFTIEFSIDAISYQHDQIRGLKGGFELLLKSWQELKKLRVKYTNLRLATITVLSPLNQDKIFDILEYIKSELTPDRIEVNLLRGTPRQKELAPANLDIFQEVAEWLNKNSQAYSFKDRLRLELAKEKRKMLIKALKEKKMPISCQAGKKLIVLFPDGEVLPCELFSDAVSKADERKPSLGNLRDYNYNLNQLLQARRARALLKRIKQTNCYCSYECAHLANIVFSPLQMAKIFFKSLF